jgi:hypothetical protein
VIGPNILVYILIGNQQMHQNDQFIVMSSQTLLHVLVHWHHHQGAHMILTSCLYVGVHYKKNNGVSSKLAPVSIVKLWIQVVMTNCCWKQWAVVAHGPCAVFHNSVRIIWAPWWWCQCTKTCSSIWLDITINWSFWCICWFSMRIYT